MTIQALAAFLISWVVPTEASRESLDADQVPRWEKHPAEQRYLRERDRQASQSWSHIPRSW